MTEEYGVHTMTPVAGTTSPWVHYTCDACGAQVRMARELAKRPKTWGTVMLYTTLVNTVTTVCGRCIAESPLLQRLLLTNVDG